MDRMEGLRAAMAAVDAYYKERGIFQGRFGFGVSPALVIIDMAYGWTDPAYPAGSARLDGAIAAIQQLLREGRIDEIEVSLAPCLLGGGVRLFDHLEGGPALLGNPTVTAGVGVTHLRYPVRRATASIASTPENAREFKPDRLAATGQRLDD